MKYRRDDTRPPRGLSWSEAVDNAVEVERRFQHLSQTGAGKLSARAFKAKAFEIAGADAKRIAEVGKLLDGTDLDSARALVGNMVRLYGDDTMSEPVPAEQLARFGRIYGREDTRGALAAGNITLAECFAVAAARAVKAKPDAFGDVEDRAAYGKELTRLIAERERLFSMIEAGWTAQDVRVETPSTTDLRDGGYVRCTFNRGGNCVTVGERCGERLAGHLLDSDAAKRAA